MTTVQFPPLAGDAVEPTRATLHAYAKAVGTIPRAHGIAHPKWWHAALAVRPEGLVTHPIPLPDGGSVAIRMDLATHQIVVRTSRGVEDEIDLRAGLTGTEVGDRLIEMVAAHGLSGPYDLARFEDDDPRIYDPAAASAYFEAFTAAQGLFERHRVGIGERVGPINLWPHGFDLAFEWFGTRTEAYDGEQLPAQLSLGFYPGGDPYFYSNPWPFDERLLATALPHGAHWTTEGFEGSILPYASLQGDPAAGEKLLAFARAVHDAAAPTLTSS
ncbi:MAG: hypothetical protein KJ698_13630 [Actinobacteria bacterium]|nr:hypothetical protein [Actinomycetota bacterium]MBU1495003.1 hypothetical protein [Actinomycetota bacterium]MBU1865654.1 hypothetical protein [Actinomycetota bacterium]